MTAPGPNSTLINVTMTTGVLAIPTGVHHEITGLDCIFPKCSQSLLTFFRIGCPRLMELLIDNSDPNGAPPAQSIILPTQTPMKNKALSLPSRPSLTTSTIPASTETTTYRLYDPTRKLAPGIVIITFTLPQTTLTFSTVSKKNANGSATVTTSGATESGTRMGGEGSATTMSMTMTRFGRPTGVTLPTEKPELS